MQLAGSKKKGYEECQCMHLSCASDSIEFIKHAVKGKSKAKAKAKERPSTTATNCFITIPPAQKYSYGGTFDLFAMDHQDLCQLCYPSPDSPTPHYEALYNALTSSPSLETETETPEED